MEEAPLKISVIVAAFNSARTIGRCIDSVTNQDYAHKELIVIDGASSDGTVDFLRNNDHRIDYWKSEPDRGVYDAWNKALDHASGDWIHFLGSDDYYLANDTLTRIAQRLMLRDPGIRVAYGQTAYCSHDGEVLHMIGTGWPMAKTRMGTGMFIPHPAVFHHRSLFDIHGKFDDTFRIAGDYEFMLRELKTNNALFLFDVVVTAHTVGGISTDEENRLSMLLEDARARKLNGLPPYTLSWCRDYVYRAAMLWFLKLLGRKKTMEMRNLWRRMRGMPALGEKFWWV